MVLSKAFLEKVPIFISPRLWTRCEKLHVIKAMENMNGSGLHIVGDQPYAIFYSYSLLKYEFSSH